MLTFTVGSGDEEYRYSAVRDLLMAIKRAS